MTPKVRQQLKNSKRKIERRLDPDRPSKFFKSIAISKNIAYQISDRVHGLAQGGIGAFQLLVQRIGLCDAIDQHLHLLKFPAPYSESDHVLNFAYNALCNGSCLNDIELLRNDVNYLNALDVDRIPDPTTAGDFCRRFHSSDLKSLQDAFDQVRIGVWKDQPAEFFEQAILDADGALVPSTAECKEGMDFAYDGTYGYHPLIVSLANTSEAMRILNRSGNRPSHEGAAEQLDLALASCFRGGFRSVLLRGDTDFSQTKYLDGWNADPRVRFLFGYDSKRNLVEMAEQLPEAAWLALTRPARYGAVTALRHRAENVKDRVVCRREFLKLTLQSEEVAEFAYRPTACEKPYRMIVVRKNITKEKGELRLQDEMRFLFYITNDWSRDAHELVFSANDRCDQENLISQLKNGICALKAPVDNLVSNGAYMTMTALAWNLKCWFALTLPETPGRWQEKHRKEKAWMLGLEFKAFYNSFVAIPCQIVRQAKQVIYRVLSYHSRQEIFFRLLAALRC